MKKVIQMGDIISPLTSVLQDIPYFRGEVIKISTKFEDYYYTVKIPKGIYKKGVQFGWLDEFGNYCWNFHLNEIKISPLPEKIEKIIW